MRRIDTVVFDYDGTIHDTSGVYITAFKRNYTQLVKDGYAPEREFEDEEITRWLGCTATEMWNTFMPELPESVKKLCSERVRSVMAELIAGGRSRLYDGVRETLGELKADGKTLLILSNCAEAYMENHRRVFGLDSLFDAYFCAETYGFRPKYEIFEYIKREYGAGCCMVGDRYHDFEAGRKNGVFTVGCAYGFGNAEELSEADIVINSIAELSQTVREYERSAQ